MHIIHAVSCYLFNLITVVRIYVISLDTFFLYKNVFLG